MPATCPASESTKTFSLELKFCNPRKLSFQDAIWSVSQLMAKTAFLYLQRQFSCRTLLIHFLQLIFLALCRLNIPSLGKFDPSPFQNSKSKEGGASPII